MLLSERLVKVLESDFFDKVELIVPKFRAAIQWHAIVI